MTILLNLFGGVMTYHQIKPQIEELRSKIEKQTEYLKQNIKTGQDIEEYHKLLGELRMLKTVEKMLLGAKVV